MPTNSKDQEDYLDVLSDLVDKYEQEHLPIALDDITPLDALRHLMEEHGMNASALGELLGDRGLGSRILNGQRGLSKSHMQKLSAHFSVSPALFLQAAL